MLNLHAPAPLPADATPISDPVTIIDDAGPAGWSAIHDAATGLLIGLRSAPVGTAELDALLADWPGNLHYAGPPAGIAAALDRLPPALATDMAGLAGRFAALTGHAAVRLRLDRIETDACRKWHLDYTDLRLVTSYAGPGTQYRLPGADRIFDIPTGAIALFKGRHAPPGHMLVEHRSPPIAGTGISRLVLVIDTPADDANRPG